MLKPKKIPEQELALRLGEAFAPILKAIDKRLIDIQAAEGLVEALIESLARRSHRAWVKSMGIHQKPWKDVGTTTKAQHRRQARELLKHIAKFVQKKLDAEVK